MVVLLSVGKLLIINNSLAKVPTEAVGRRTGVVPYVAVPVLEAQAIQR